MLAARRVAHRFGSDKLYMCLSNKCFNCSQCICCGIDVRPSQDHRILRVQTVQINLAPSRFSSKIFPKDFLTRISRKIFLQDFFARFLPNHFPVRFSCKNFPQDIPARFSSKIFPQDFPARFSSNIFPQDFPARFSHMNFLQDFPTRISCKIFQQDFPGLDPNWLALHHPIPNAKFPPITAFHKLAFSPPPCPIRFSCKIFPSWILIGWLPITLPIPNAKFPPITALLNRPTCLKSAKVSPLSFP